MKYAIFFGLFAIVLGTTAFSHAGWYGTLLYPAISFALMSTAYLGLGPGVMGKRADGTLSPIAIILLLPYLLLVWTVWNLWRIASREPKWNALNDDYWIGRRLVRSEAMEEFASVVDLTTEFTEPKPMRDVACYRAFPMLDATCRTKGEIRQFAQAMIKMPKPVYIHCAQGHGRTGLLAAALLLERGDAKMADEALRMVRNVRPGVKLSESQFRMLNEIARDIAGD